MDTMTPIVPTRAPRVGTRTASTMLDPKILWPAVGQSFVKLDPRLLWRNPVMFVVAIVSTLTTVLFIRDLAIGASGLGFALQINIWLWFTVLFANFAEAVAEGRGKAQAASLRRAKTETMAQRITQSGAIETVAGTALRAGDVVLVEAGEIIPGDGPVELNPGRERVRLIVRNLGDRPVQVGSHYHFAAVNPGLEFDRDAARGHRLDVAAGTSVRFEPGIEREVDLVPLRGGRRVPGLRSEHAGEF